MDDPQHYVQLYSRFMFELSGEPFIIRTTWHPLVGD